jgi:dsDNA-specific endonuclease/ATPase MutS2
MRDIRGDLQERANQIAGQISTTQEQFDKHIEQLNREHQTLLQELTSALHNVRTVIGIEGRLLGSSPSAQPARSDSLSRKVASVGFR